MKFLSSPESKDSRIYKLIIESMRLNPSRQPKHPKPIAIWHLFVGCIFSKFTFLQYSSASNIQLIDEILNT